MMKNSIIDQGERQTIERGIYGEQEQKVDTAMEGTE